MNIKKTSSIFFLSLVVFTVLLFIIPRGFISSDLGNVVLTISTFLFGLVGGFFIVITVTDYNTVKTLLANETGGWVGLFKNIANYDRPSGTKLGRLIDDYIIKSFDYELIDYAKGNAEEFTKLVKMVYSIPNKHDRSSEYQTIMGSINSIITTKQQLVILCTKTLNKFQWLVLFILSLPIAASLYGLRTGEPFFDFVTVIISSAVVLLLLIIRELDLYRWNERTFGFDIFEKTLELIGRLPYYPGYALQGGRIIPTEKVYRVGVYRDYPRSLQKTIKIVRQNK